ncbi:TatD family hydrolase [Spirochaeta africana]|uniref:Mg-dependent DNase n=1 Tax=Spirochaeta africana (strain ATCC 700263 / DSM 8902 / Z-7692) TaxID=889378 RepID=H9UMB4_SPIAZ|nr:TatD family hydrolase [Spirochaeta africana]AFG38657.1 Mg-dependent DNase [Spirochaeta africana DSM 8902]
MLLDAHLHCPDPDTAIPPTGEFWVNAASPDDWSTVLTLTRTYPNIRGFIGLHPWHTAEAPTGWLPRLAQLLRGHPALGIGEIGLDRCGRHAATLPRQQEVLRQQLQLAVELRRPVSLHCCRAYAILVGELQEIAATRQPIQPDRAGPLKGLIHRFAAGLPELQQLCELGLHISFHPSLAEANPGQQALLRHCPRERLLLETDAQHGPDMQVLQQHYDQAAAILGISRTALAQKVHKNGTICTNTGPAGR